MEIEERARLMGWVPRDDFKGDPDKWTEAETYVERADNIMPIMKAQMGKYEETIATQGNELKANKKDIAALRETMRKIASVNQKVSETAYNRALETIRAEQTQAITAGDGDKWNRLEKDKDKLEKNKPEPIEVQSPTPDNTEENPEYQEWLSDNPWYEENKKLQEYADSVVYGVSQMTGKKGKALLDEVKAKAEKLFPEEFENPNRKQAGVVSGGTTQGKVKTKSDGYNDLPADVKRACDDYVAQKLGTRKDYLEIYNEA